jgi:hypothetical protein
MCFWYTKGIDVLLNGLRKTAIAICADSGKTGGSGKKERERQICVEWQS